VNAPHCPLATDHRPLPAGDDYMRLEVLIADCWTSLADDAQDVLQAMADSGHDGSGMLGHAAWTLGDVLAVAMRLGLIEMAARYQSEARAVGGASRNEGVDVLCR
jgi:hypothetical protein